MRSNRAIGIKCNRLHLMQKFLVFIKKFHVFNSVKKYSDLICFDQMLWQKYRIWINEKTNSRCS